MGRPSRSVCTLSNIKPSIKVLNSELNVLDYKVVSYSEKYEKEVLVQLVNICYELTSALKQKICKINEQNEDIIKLQTTIKSDRKEKDRLLQKYTNESRKIEDLKLKVDQSETQITTLTTQTKTLKQQIHQLQHALSFQKLQHEHEIRGKEKINTNLKNKLYQSFSNESGLSNDIVKQGKSTDLIMSDEIVSKYISQLHNNIQIVLSENVKYRTLLESIYNKLTVYVIDCLDSYWQHLPDLPCHLVIEAIERNFNIFLEKIQDNPL